MTLFVLQFCIFVNVVMGSLFDITQYNHHKKAGPILHTGPLSKLCSKPTKDRTKNAAENTLKGPEGEKEVVHSFIADADTRPN